MAPQPTLTEDRFHSSETFLVDLEGDLVLTGAADSEAASAGAGVDPSPGRTLCRRIAGATAVAAVQTRIIWEPDKAHHVEGMETH